MSVQKERLYASIYQTKTMGEKSNAPSVKKKKDENSVSFILESHLISGMNGILLRKNRHFDITRNGL